MESKERKHVKTNDFLQAMNEKDFIIGEQDFLELEFESEGQCRLSDFKGIKMKRSYG